MRIIDGNIFEAMRLVLPEHRELMERSRREAKRRKRPLLSEDEWSEMNYILGEALQCKRSIRVTLFTPFEDVVLEGIPVTVKGKLCLLTASGTRELRLQSIVKIETV